LTGYWRDWVKGVTWHSNGVGPTKMPKKKSQEGFKKKNPHRCGRQYTLTADNKFRDTAFSVKRGIENVIHRNSKIKPPKKNFGNAKRNNIAHQTQKLFDL